MVAVPEDNASPVREPDDVSRFIERFAAVLTDLGMARMPARVFVALLTIDSGKVTAGELAELLRASPGAVSGAVRYLMQLNLLRREREPGERRDHYVLHDDTWYEGATRKDQGIRQWAVTAKEGIDVLGPDTAAGRRLAETLHFLEFMQAKLPELIEEWSVRRQELRAKWAAEDEVPEA
ncbi:MarR family protein [Tamaricihabitans halophyticus]|uniref:MarR family protein n=1 Tax=Tamaricihabitans halophyticus TaxID=1262583 RepID=A0A4R2QIM7_9PSEU|nr:MarR family transcriptional regulator [Tamaricihabitans halophyticus]TCP48629.1 MarR family protein [Tamaricihabitans halophyticus]